MDVMCGDLYVVASSPAIKTSPHAFLQRYQSVLQWHSQPPTNPFPDRNQAGSE